MKDKRCMQPINSARMICVLLVIFLTGCNTPSPTNTPIPPVALTIPGVVLYYSFDGDARDISGNGIDGDVHGAILTADRFGIANRAYYFDGVDDSIYFDASKMPLGAAARTISAWVKADSYPPAPSFWEELGSRATVIGWGIDNYKKISEMQIVNGQIQFHDYFMGVTSKKTLETGKWYHLVIVYTEQNIYLYVNGEQETFESGVLETVPGKGRIGAFPDQIVTSQIFPEGYDLSYFHGTIDDISIYNQALSDIQIQALYAEGGWGGQ